MGQYANGQVCLNGHKITGDVSSGFAQNFCSECGASTIAKCPTCNTNIRGYYEHDNSGGVVILSVPEFNVPRHCHNCGSAFPWIADQISAASELVDELEELSADEKAKLRESIAFLTKDSPKTELASIRFKKILSKANTAIGNAIISIITSIATDAAKKQLGI